MKKNENKKKIWAAGIAVIAVLAMIISTFAITRTRNKISVESENTVELTENSAERTEAVNTGPDLNTTEKIIEEADISNFVYAETDNEELLAEESVNGEEEPVLIEDCIQGPVAGQETEEEPAEEYSQTSAEVIEISAEPAKLTVTEEMAARPDMIGRISVPNAGIDVAVFSSSNPTTEWLQECADKEDSAVYIPAGYYQSGVEAILCDHNNQEFSKLKDVVVGDYMYFDNGVTTTSYVCTRICGGTNERTGLIDEDGVNINVLNNGGICTYTCQENSSYHVLLAFWETVD